jgi:hypothetical protein
LEEAKIQSRGPVVFLGGRRLEIEGQFWKGWGRGEREFIGRGNDKGREERTLAREREETHTWVAYMHTFTNTTNSYREREREKEREKERERERYT